MVIYVCRSLYPKNSGLKKKTLFWALNVDCRYKLENPTSKIFFATTLHSVPILQLIVIMFKFYNVTMLQLLLYLLTIVNPVISAQFRTITRNGIPHNSAQRNSQYITLDWSLVATPAAYWAPPLLNLPTSFLIICRVNSQSMMVRFTAVTLKPISIQ